MFLEVKIENLNYSSIKKSIFFLFSGKNNKNAFLLKNENQKIWSKLLFYFKFKKKYLPFKKMYLKNEQNLEQIFFKSIFYFFKFYCKIFWNFFKIQNGTPVFSPLFTLFHTSSWRITPFFQINFFTSLNTSRWFTEF